ncbi:MAG: hypothetical protein F4Y44_08800 [Chloroflexi bacterium]|nr:hypothetical protein [Chloroflexota bacterium]
MNDHSLPSRAELKAAYDDIARIHRTHLSQHGVRLPDANSYKWVWLGMLHYHKGERVHKNRISDAVRSIYPEAARDQQVRHLKRDGWNIEGSQGYHSLGNPYQPSPDFVNERARRQGRLSAESFDDLKTSFGNRCATCGAVEGEPDPRYGADVVQLQQGHQDPDADSASIANIIPQCQFCNRAYRRDFVFDDKGRVRAVADIGPVRRASLPVQRKVWDFLRPKFQ